jgi:hypothetical protein
MPQRVPGSNELETVHLSEIKEHLATTARAVKMTDAPRMNAPWCRGETVHHHIDASQLHGVDLHDAHTGVV